MLSHSINSDVPNSNLIIIAANLAKGKNAYQSSEGWGGKPARAVDGNLNPLWAGASCTHTQSQPNAWWAVDLGGIKVVKSVAITNRGDCCGKL